MTGPKPAHYRIAFAGRPMRRKSTPSEWLSTPELQVFSQILDTLVARSPNGNVRPLLAQFEITPDQTALKLTWIGKCFADGSPIHADEVTACLQASCWKFENLIPESRDWFSVKLRAVGAQEIHFENLGPQEAIRILKHLALPDYGIYKTDPSDRNLIGTGPYRIQAETQDSLTLAPNLHHSEHSKAVSHLEFLYVHPEEYSEALELGRIDEYVEYGTIPTEGASTNLQKHFEHVPSTHAAVGLLLFNARSGAFKDKEVRSYFSNLLAQTIRDGFADPSWASPRSITPPGFEGHGGVDYLDLSKGLDSAPPEPRSIAIAVTNPRQRKRLETLFMHPAFTGWDPTYFEFKNYDDLRKASRSDSGTTLDLAFIAIRSDTLLASEFFDFLSAESATCLFESDKSQSAIELKNNPSTTILNLETIIREEAICFPIGYYFTIRVLSNRPGIQVGSSTFEDSPRYLRIEGEQIRLEWNTRRIKLEQYWRYAFDRRADETIYSKAARAIHDLKSPLALLNAVAHGQEVSADSAELIKMARTRIDEIIKGILPAPSNRSRTRASFVIDHVKPGQLIAQVVDEIRAYAPKTIRFEIDAPESDSEIRLPRVGLYSIAANLIKNATEALAEQPDGKIHISVKNSKELELVIEDNGPGFTDAALEAIERGNEYTSKSQGTGVGLKQAILSLRANGGGFTLKNNPQGGATIRVSVPRISS